MIPVIVKALKKPGTDEKKYYVQVAPTTPITLERVARNISSRCTVTETDCLAVLNELETEVITAMQNGNSVRLGRLGSFRPTVSSYGAATEEEADATQGKTVRSRFTMGSRLRAALLTSNADVQFVKRSYTIVTDSADHA